MHSTGLDFKPYIVNDVQEVKRELAQPLKTIESLMNPFDTINTTKPYHVQHHHLSVTHFHNRWQLAFAQPWPEPHFSKNDIRKQPIFKKAKIKGTIPHPNEEINTSSATRKCTTAAKRVSNLREDSVFIYRLEASEWQQHPLSSHTLVLHT